MQLEFQRLGRLRHLIPAFFDIWVEILDLSLRFPDNHAIKVLVSDIPVAHVDFETLELLEISGH